MMICMIIIMGVKLARRRKTGGFISPQESFAMMMIFVHLIVMLILVVIMNRIKISMIMIKV